MFNKKQTQQSGWPRRWQGPPQVPHNRSCKFQPRSRAAMSTRTIARHTCGLSSRRKSVSSSPSLLRSGDVIRSINAFTAHMPSHPPKRSRGWCSTAAPSLVNTGNLRQGTCHLTRVTDLTDRTQFSVVKAALRRLCDRSTASCLRERGNGSEETTRTPNPSRTFPPYSIARQHSHSLHALQ